MKSKTIICDIDGTISDSEWRSHLARNKAWAEFHAFSVKDKPIKPIVEMVSVLSWEASIVLLTGRTEAYRQTTMNWLRDNELAPFIDGLLMRPNNDFSSDIDFKLKSLESYFGDKERVLEKVWMVIDDRDSVVKGMREYGLTVLQPCNGSY